MSIDGVLLAVGTPSIAHSAAGYDDSVDALTMCSIHHAGALSVMLGMFE